MDRKCVKVRGELCRISYVSKIPVNIPSVIICKWYIPDAFAVPFNPSSFSFKLSIPGKIPAKNIIITN